MLRVPRVQQRACSPCLSSSWEPLCVLQPGTPWKLEQESGSDFSLMLCTLQSFPWAHRDRRRDYPALGESEHGDTQQSGQGCGPAEAVFIPLVQAQAAVPPHQLSRPLQGCRKTSPGATVVRLLHTAES